MKTERKIRLINRAIIDELKIEFIYKNKVRKTTPKLLKKTKHAGDLIVICEFLNKIKSFKLSEISQLTVCDSYNIQFKDFYYLIRFPECQYVIKNITPFEFALIVHETRYSLQKIDENLYFSALACGVENGNNMIK